MKLLIIALLLVLLLPAQGIPYAVTIGNVSVSYDIPKLHDGDFTIHVSHAQVESPQSPYYNQTSYDISLGQISNTPLLSIYPGSLPSISYVKKNLAYNGGPNIIEKDELVNLSAGSWQVCGQPGIGGYIVTGDPENALGQRAWYEVRASIFFQKGPYVCWITKFSCHGHSEGEVRKALEAFNESLTKLKVEVM